MAAYTPKDPQGRKLLEKEGLRLRPAAEADLPAIKKLKLAAFDELCPTLLKWYAKHPEVMGDEFNGPAGQDPKRRCVLVLVNRRGALVGCGGLMQMYPKKEPDIGELSDIYLEKAFRGRGLGEALVRELLTHEKAFGFRETQLTTRVEFEAAVKLYKRLGFHSIVNKKYPGSKNSLAFCKPVEQVQEPEL